MSTHYTKDHEWIRIDGDIGTVGITDYAQQQLGDVVFVDLPAKGKALAKGGEAAVVESVKAASEVYAPVTGEVVDTNSVLEGAPSGIRVNVVNPDAVIRGSKIWDGDWRQERAGAHGIDSGTELEEHYRKRSMLGRDVLPEDIAQAVYFLASDMSAKSTGNMINVDAGNASAFVR